MSYKDVKKLADHHELDLSEYINSIKIESFDEQKFCKMDVFNRSTSEDLEKYLSTIFGKMKNKYEGRSYTEYVSELISNVLLEDIIPVLFNKCFGDRWRIRKNNKGSDADRIIKKNSSKINCNSDYIFQKKGEKPFSVELVTDYTELIKRSNFLTFRGYEGLREAKYKNKWESLYAEKKSLLVLSLFNSRWKSCLVKPNDFSDHNVSPSPRKDYGRGAVKVSGFRKKMKDCNFLNKKS